MSSKLDQSLEDISKSRRQARGNNRRRSSTAKATTTKAPVGGIKKNTKPAKGPARGPVKGPAIGPTSPVNESKIIVSGLPHDVSEASIKDYFVKTVGPVKRVTVTYNQNGVSRGIASIVFSKPDTAAKAAKELNGTLVDGRPMKVEVVVDATHAPQVAAPKPLSERVTQAKAQPKPVTATKNAAAGGRRGRARPRKPKNPTQRKKTAEELDAEMEDYFVGAENAPAGTTNTNGAAAATGDETMAEIS
ncbi:RNA annealing protein Yra1, putative [Talaromyces stipitatus ATCC 10500]|uniref:RNA annealing protein Yra1, putative n=1 Tax=Talaromyces stipitatus (strain ATCC 10500 / CBS 375.48 / QM 6759 / NRRL 1006) TaxID=441959 RepID=B8MRC3_TALSN|nr:RNA annealing protein Yra1, putative [Talaromyces stipitatus ATCC 10500]EED13018.1 RNA annealing protein Yra1, putative [Talaromyces stipitatus ATCC 10500]